VSQHCYNCYHRSIPMITDPVQVSPASFFLGIDGGGSKTTAVIVDAHGNELARGQAGSSNHGVVGLQQAVAHIHAALAQAKQAANIETMLNTAWLGLAGIDSPAEHQLLFPHIQSLAQKVILTNDADLVLSALDDLVGIALIAGTGSAALGRDRHGTSKYSGGWGHIIGDEGSGYDIGRMALQAAVRAADFRGEETILLDYILQYWHIYDVQGILNEVYQHTDNAKIARLSSLVFTAARAGDHMAQQIVQHAANELALAVIALSKQLDFIGIPLPLALGGGLLLHESDFRAQVIDTIRQSHPISQVVLAEQPALNAARAAIRLEKTGEDPSIL
jgi:N-acetylglucosamine kinase-like BadF-type ATPase